MRNVIQLNNNLDEISFQEFLETLNGFEDKSDITVYLNSVGGKSVYIPAFKHIMESYNMKLVGFGRLFSSALLLFLHANVRKELLDDTLSMYHYPYLTEVRVSSLTLKCIDDMPWKHQYHEFIDMYGYLEPLLGLEEKDRKKLLKGEDFYFTTEQIREVLKKMPNNFGKK